MGGASSSIRSECNSLRRDGHRGLGTAWLRTLPPELLRHLGAFLLGGEILRLARCDSRLFEALSEDTVWRGRLLYVSSHAENTKQLYCKARSLRFRGGEDCLQLPLALFPKQRDVSFDLWFALDLRRTSRSQQLSVLVGAQDVSIAASPRRSPQQNQVFAGVDQHHNLFCSVLNDKPVVARSLECNRWYHVALIYEHALGRQTVYLDGMVIHSAEGTTQWPWLQYAQVGAGYHRDQWASFNGLVDEMRVSYSPWTSAQVQRLARGKRIHAPMAYCLTRDRCRSSVPSDLRYREVSCSRPVERYMEMPAVKRQVAQSRRRSSKPSNHKTKKSVWELMTQCL